MMRAYIPWLALLSFVCFYIYFSFTIQTLWMLVVTRMSPTGHESGAGADSGVDPSGRTCGGGGDGGGGGGGGSGGTGDSEDAMVTESGGALRAVAARGQDLRNRRRFVASFSNPEVRPRVVLSRSITVLQGPVLMTLP
jgi:hypothetical protein